MLWKAVESSWAQVLRDIILRSLCCYGGVGRRMSKEGSVKRREKTEGREMGAKALDKEEAWQQNESVHAVSPRQYDSSCWAKAMEKTHTFLMLSFTCLSRHYKTTLNVSSLSVRPPRLCVCDTYFRPCHFSQRPFGISEQSAFLFPWSLSE